MKPATRTVLVTGATGYIGRRLVPRLLEAGCRVRCLARDAARLQGRPWLGQAELVAGDCLRAERTYTQMTGGLRGPSCSLTATRWKNRGKAMSLF